MFNNLIHSAPKKWNNFFQRCRTGINGRIPETTIKSGSPCFNRSKKYLFFAKLQQIKVWSTFFIQQLSECKKILISPVFANNISVGLTGSEFRHVSTILQTDRTTVPPRDVDSWPKWNLTSLGFSVGSGLDFARSTPGSAPMCLQTISKCFPVIFWKTLCPETFPESA